MTKVIIFKSLVDTNDPYQISIDSIFERIRGGKSAHVIEGIRKAVAEGNTDEADRLKKTLPCIMFPAEVVMKGDRGFREDKSVKVHSGILPLDWDGVDDPDLKMEQLKSDPYIYAAWLSPSGKGVRSLVKCPASVEHHSSFYTALLDRYPDLDSTSKNISRITFESYDPNLYVNDKALIWDRKITEAERKVKQAQVSNVKASQVISTAVAMVRSSYDGNKHEILLKAAKLLGGYVATGRLDEAHARQVLEEEIQAKMPRDMEGARKTIIDGIEYGKAAPLMEAKAIERENQYLKGSNGQYDFLADEAEMDHYLGAVLDGSLKMGLPTGLIGLNPHWLFKEHSLDFICGGDNTGKSVLAWYLATLAAKFHNWKVVIQSAENGDGEMRKKIMELFLGKSIKISSPDEIIAARNFVKDHFRIISSRVFHTMEECLTKCELIYDSGFKFNLVILEPYNSFDVPSKADMYRNNIHNLNLLRVFKTNFSSVWICDHISTEASRAKDRDGYPLAPWKTDVEYGAMKANKADNMFIVHRLVNHPERWNETQVHVVKIKSVETGGRITPKDNPVILKMNADLCGYTSNGIDPINKNRISIEGKIGDQIKLV